MTFLLTSSETMFWNKGCWLSSGQSGTRDLSSISYRLWLCIRTSSLPHTQGGILAEGVAVIERDLLLIRNTISSTISPTPPTSVDCNSSGFLHDGHVVLGVTHHTPLAIVSGQAGLAPAAWWLPVAGVRQDQRQTTLPLCLGQTTNTPFPDHSPHVLAYGMSDTLHGHTFDSSEPDSGPSNGNSGHTAATRQQGALTYHIKANGALILAVSGVTPEPVICSFACPAVGARTST
eukprot:CAMPEP_0172888906 /NCGR_PEP_ID=MMETSP1075-20121228/137490_1 /TAXON_ID=2916 /ORGANISM="Ceratium fusus, Strain PA161109" /LENGTH=232 /DNA_ID=CAMNT_0013742853 /DNA_START=55 /DNA_END=752 /DNA_ORIENTATION=-